MLKFNIVFAILMMLSTGCKGQIEKTMANKNNNPLICDIDLGACEALGFQKINQFDTVRERPIKIIYFTDPICSSCWGIEPQLRKIKLAYGGSLEIEYRMGGLLPDWSYNSGGISSPADVAHHWDEVSVHYDMPIDGDIWLEDPLDSSYPPSIAFKAAQMQDSYQALQFMRRLREMVFMEKKNITKWEYISIAADEVGLNVSKLKTDYEGKARELFEGDLAFAQTLGVRGFPTMYFQDSLDKQTLVYGSKPYQNYERAIHETLPTAIAFEYDTSWTNLFSIYPTWTKKEFSVVSGLSVGESEALLQHLESEGKLKSYATKNGNMWVLDRAND